MQINPTLALLIQTILVFAQMVNGGLAVVEGVPAWLTIVLSAVVGAGQFFVQHLGNQSVPPPKPN